MKNAKELIEILKKVDPETFNQDVYLTEDGIKQEICGCIMHHYELHRYGKLVSGVSYVEICEITSDEYNYIFGPSSAIMNVAAKRDWPIPEEFDIASAIRRIEFIDQLHKTTNDDN